MTFRLHVLGLPHTRTHESFSHCAFTGKVQKLIPMMRAQGCEVWHYGNGEENPGADEHFPIFSGQIFNDFFPEYANPQHFVGSAAHVDHPYYRAFNRRLERVLAKSVEPGDFVCMPFGHAHQAGTRSHKGVNIETGIGYPVCVEPFRVYESNAWAAHIAGMEKSQGSPFGHWVIPNYFNVFEWDLGTAPRRYLAYFGRLVESKGLNIVREIAKSRPDLDVLLCGQGDPAPWLSEKWPNLKHVGTLAGRARSPFLGGAIALLTPTQYLEPFGGVTIEANLCGTPAITSTHGVFPETIANGANGYRCQTLGDYLAAIEWAEQLSVDHHALIRRRAVAKYSLEAIGPRYIQVFSQLRQLQGRGWYSHESAIGPVSRAIAV